MKESDKNNNFFEKQTENSNEKEKSNMSIGIWMSLGAVFGMCLGSVFMNSIPGGMSLPIGSMIGMLIGMFAGMITKNKK